MARYFSVPQLDVTGEDDRSEESLVFVLDAEKPRSGNKSRKTIRLVHDVVVYSVVAALIVGLLATSFSTQPRCSDPSVGMYSPAQEEISYEQVAFGRYFENRSPYTQKPSKELDDMWEELYKFGLSGITSEEASHLQEPTAHLPHDDGTYVVTLGVFHQLHCVNHLRKALYPDEYPGLWEYSSDGTVKHDGLVALHRDHCLDILRQTLMCHADVTPMPFFYRESDDNVYSKLATTQTCRNFEKIKDWAKERQLTHWRWNETSTQQAIPA